MNFVIIMIINKWEYQTLFNWLIKLEHFGFWRESRFK
jgi:hypothetical protein